MVISPHDGCRGGRFADRPQASRVASTLRRPQSGVRVLWRIQGIAQATSERQKCQERLGAFCELCHASNTALLSATNRSF